MYQQVEEIFMTFIRYVILILEGLGAAVILLNTLRSVGQWLKKDKVLSRNILTEGISSGLSFLLSSEVLKTIVAPDWREIGMTCAVLAMRAAMTVLIKWEEKQEEEREEQKEMKAKKAKLAEAGQELAEAGREMAEAGREQDGKTGAE